MDANQSPEMKAMQEALKRAEEAAEQRRLAKQAAAEHEGAARVFDLELEEDLEVIAQTRVVPFAVEPEPEPEDLHVLDHGPADLSEVLQQLDRLLPDLPDREIHGDLEVLKAGDRAQAWYELAGEESIPAALRGLPGPLDVKRLLQALIIEVGDVKRTNAILMEVVTRLEEKVDRTNRLLRERRQP